MTWGYSSCPLAQEIIPFFFPEERFSVNSVGIQQGQDRHISRNQKTVFPWETSQVYRINGLLQVTHSNSNPFVMKTNSKEIFNLGKSPLWILRWLVLFYETTLAALSKAEEQ